MKSIIFDIHDTIAYQEKTTEYFINVTFSKFLCHFVPRSTYSEYRNVWKTLDQKYQESTQKGIDAISVNDYTTASNFLQEESYSRKFEKILEFLEIPNDELLHLRINDVFQQEWIRGLKLFPFSIDLFKSLINKYQCGIVTNFRDSQWIRKWLRRKNLNRFFNDNVVISDEVGYRKPHPEIFEEIINMMAISDKKDVVYIGDNLIEDKLGAEKLGIQTLIIGQDLSSIEDLPQFL